MVLVTLNVTPSLDVASDVVQQGKKNYVHIVRIGQNSQNLI